MDVLRSYEILKTVSFFEICNVGDTYHGLTCPLLVCAMIIIVLHMSGSDMLQRSREMRERSENMQVHGPVERMKSLGRAESEVQVSMGSNCREDVLEGRAKTKHKSKENST